MSPLRLPERIVADNGIVIRHWDQTDAEAMGDLVSGSLEHLRPWTAWARTEPLAVDARLRLFRRWDRYWASGAGAVYAIETVRGLVGGCSMHRRVGLGGIDLGYWLGQSGTGQGIATRTAQALTKASMSLADIDFVQISHAAPNTASAAVAERLGFVNITAADEHAVTTWQHKRSELPRDSTPEQR